MKACVCVATQTGVGACAWFPGTSWLRLMAVWRETGGLKMFIFWRKHGLPLEIILNFYRGTVYFTFYILYLHKNYGE